MSAATPRIHSCSDRGRQQAHEWQKVSSERAERGALPRSMGSAAAASWVRCCISIQTPANTLVNCALRAGLAAATCFTAANRGKRTRIHPGHRTLTMLSRRPSTVSRSSASSCDSYRPSSRSSCSARARGRAGELPAAGRNRRAWRRRQAVCRLRLPSGLGPQPTPHLLQIPCLPQVQRGGLRQADRLHKGLGAVHFGVEIAATDATQLLEDDAGPPGRTEALRPQTPDSSPSGAWRWRSCGLADGFRVSRSVTGACRVSVAACQPAAAGGSIA